MTGSVRPTFDLLTRQCLFQNAALGRIATGGNPLNEFFAPLEPEEPRVESAMVGDMCSGWMWPCGSVYMESEHDADPEVARLSRVFDAIDVVASLAGAPHTLDHAAALALYREHGWLQDERLTIAQDTEDLTGVVLLYRPTLVLHDRNTPNIPTAVATAELRLEVAGPKGLITSARVLGFAIRHQQAKATAWFMAHVLSMALGDTSCFLPYTRNDGQRLIVLGTPQSSAGDARVPPAVATTFLDHFRRHFIGRAINDDRLEASRMMADMGLADAKEISERDNALCTMSIVYATDRRECTSLASRLDPLSLEAVQRFAAADTRPGFAAFFNTGQRESTRIDAIGIAQRMEQASQALTVELGDVFKDEDFRSMANQDVRIVGIGAKPVLTAVLHYAPFRDRHPFITWDNSMLGLFDTLELISPGASQGEGYSALTPTKLGYSARPSLCLVLQAPDERVTKATAERVAAGMLIGAARIARAKTHHTANALVCVELQTLSSEEEAEEGDIARNRSLRALAAAFGSFGFLQCSEWVLACPASEWERICEWDGPFRAVA